MEEWLTCDLHPFRQYFCYVSQGDGDNEKSMNWNPVNDLKDQPSAAIQPATATGAPSA